MEHLEDIASIELTYSSKMLQSLINIDNNTRALAIGIGQSDQYGKFSSDPLLYNSVSAPEQNFASNAAQSIGHQMDIDGLFGPVVDFLFASGQKVQDSGIKFNPTQKLSDVFNEGLESEYYAIVDTWDKFFGFKTNTSMQTTEIDGEIAQWFTTMTKNVATSVLDGVSLLKPEIKRDQLETKLMDQEVGLDLLSLKGLGIDEMEDAIGGVFSKYADEISLTMIPELEAFQQVGEGMFETLVRVSSQVELVNVSLSQFGFEAVNFTEVQNKQGDVGAEVVKATILLNEEYSAISDIMQTVTGDAKDLVDTYKELT